MRVINHEGFLDNLKESIRNKDFPAWAYVMTSSPYFFRAWVGEVTDLPEIKRQFEYEVESRSFLREPSNAGVNPMYRHLRRPDNGFRSGKSW